MMTDKKRFEGSYAFKNGKFVPQGDIKLIEEMTLKLKLLADTGSCCYGSFYYDPSEKIYWRYVQHEDYRTYLQIIERSEIEKKYPSVDCNHLLDVK
jgi:hypothetical protein